MPHVECPKCSREITLRDAELALLIECAECQTRFYAMMPMDGPLPPHPARTSQTRQSDGTTETPSQKSSTEEPAPAEVPAPPRARKPRKKKKKQDWVPAIVGISLGLVVFVGFGLGIFLLVWFDVLNPRRPDPTNAVPGKPTDAPVPPPAGNAAVPAGQRQPAPEPESGQPPDALPEPALPPPSGTIDLGKSLKKKTL